jgi:hypothetical protein
LGQRTELKELIWILESLLNRIPTLKYTHKSWSSKGGFGLVWVAQDGEGLFLHGAFIWENIWLGILLFVSKSKFHFHSCVFPFLLSMELIYLIWKRRWCYYLLRLGYRIFYCKRVLEKTW